MAKDKSLINPAKRKELSSNGTVHVEDMETKVKKKKKKMEVEEASVIPDGTITTSDRKKNKKKKTKKTETPEPEGEEDLSPEEKRVLERKIKKILKKEEKKRLKSEGKTEQKPEASGPTAPQLALDYLKCWAKKRTEWKFQKTRQTWLLQHMFDFTQISDKKFAVLLRYMEGLQGSAKDTTVKKALALVEESGQVPEDKDIQQRAHRAREVIQFLS